MCAVDVHAASHSGTGLMATLEPESEMEEESTAPYSSPLDPATLDVPSDHSLDFPEAPDPNPDDLNRSLSVNHSFAMPMIPALQVSAASSTLLAPPGLPDRITSPPPFIPKPLSFHPIPSLTHAPPSTPASTPLDPSPTPDDALQSIIEEIEFSGGTATVAKENPLIAHICAKIHEQEHCSFLDLLLLSASHIVDHLGLYLETCYALPAQEGVDTLGNRYQDYLILRTSLTLSCAETTAIPAGHATYRGCAFTRFYPHPCTPVAKTLGSPVPATIEDPDPPPSCPNPSSLTPDMTVTPFIDQTIPLPIYEPPISGLQLLASAVECVYEVTHPDPSIPIIYARDSPPSPSLSLESFDFPVFDLQLLASTDNHVTYANNSPPTPDDNPPSSSEHTSLWLLPSQVDYLVNLFIQYPEEWCFLVNLFH